jgi:hypothetical protein
MQDKITDILCHFGIYETPETWVRRIGPLDMPAEVVHTIICRYLGQQYRGSLGASSWIDSLRRALPVYAQCRGEPDTYPSRVLDMLSRRDERPLVLEWLRAKYALDMVPGSRFVPKSTPRVSKELIIIAECLHVHRESEERAEDFGMRVLKALRAADRWGCVPLIAWYGRHPFPRNKLSLDMQRLHDYLESKNLKQVRWETRREYVYRIAVYEDDGWILNWVKARWLGKDR